MPERKRDAGTKPAECAQADAPRRSCLGVVPSFQDDYQSSCGSATGDIIANFTACARRKFAFLTPAAPFGQPVTVMLHAGEEEE